MSRKFLTPIDLGTNELQNAVVGNLTVDPTGVKGRIYFDSINNVMKLYDGTSWKAVSTGAGSTWLGSTQLNLGNNSGDITSLSGMSSISSTSFTGALTGNASTATKLATARNINGVAFDGTADITVTSSTTNALTIGTGLSGTSFNGSAAVTISIDSSVVTLSGSQTLTNKTLTSPTINGANLTGTITVPTPVNGTDAANKNYVDSAVAGLTWKSSVWAMATSNVSLTGSTGSLTIDGQTFTATQNGQRILLTGQSTASQNGIYVYTDAGSGYTMARSSDADTYSKLNGATVFVEFGTSYVNSSWTQAAVLTSLSGQNWVQFAGATSITAGSGLVASGNSFNVGAGTGITVNADSVQISATYAGQSSITTVGTIGTGTWQGTIVGPTYGGTGVNNGSSTITLGGNLTTSGSNPLTLTTTGTTNVTLPTSGTLVNSAVTALTSLTRIGLSSAGFVKSDASGNLSVDTTVTRKATGANTTGTSFSVNHGFGQWVTAQIFDATSGAMVECDIVNSATGGGTTTFSFTASQAAGAYTYVIVG